MSQRLRRLLAIILCASLGAAAELVSVSLSAGSFRTEDRNGDGRPDVWRMYDRNNQLFEVAIDTNFDGRSDVRERYEGGAIVSRESDRNFDDRVDLVQQFNAITHEQVRVIEDVDYDGTADLLVLFQDGRAVFSTWSHQRPVAVSHGWSAANSAVASGTAADSLVDLPDPFRTDLAVRALSIVAGSDDSVGTLTATGLPAANCAFVYRVASSSALAGTSRRYVPSAVLDLHAPRGPPVSHS